MSSKSSKNMPLYVMTAAAAFTAAFVGAWESTRDQEAIDAAKLRKAQIEETVNQAAVELCKTVLEEGNLSAKKPSHRFSVDGVPFRCNFEKTTLPNGVSQVRVTRELTEGQKISNSHRGRLFRSGPKVVKTFDVK